MEQKHIGIDLAAVELPVKLWILLEGQDLSGVQDVSGCLKLGDEEWQPHPVVFGEASAFDSGDRLVGAPTQDCPVTKADLDVLKYQKVVESAGYQWQEHSQVAVPHGRRYLVTITRGMMPGWTVASPNALGWGYRPDRVSCWKEAALHAATNPAAGSQLAKEHWYETTVRV